MKPLFAEDTPTQAHNRRLRILLGMTDETVAANEQGQLSESQRQDMLAGIKFTLFFLAIGSLLMGVLLSSFISNTNELVTYVALVLVGVVCILGYSVSKTFSDIRSNQVRIYEGVLRRESVKDAFGRNITPDRYIIGKKELHPPASLREILHDGQVYRVICTVHSQKFLGAQILSELPPDTNAARTPRNRQPRQTTTR